MYKVFISLTLGLLLGIALSVDAFMLGLIYGLSLKTRKEIWLTSILVGLCHFLMSIFGFFITHFILRQVLSLPLFQTYFKGFGTLILLMLGFIILHKPEQETTSPRQGLVSPLLFSLSVSMDSFFVGIALISNPHMNIWIVASLLFITTCCITLTAFKIIYHTRNRIHVENLNLLAGILLVLIALINLFFF